MSAIPPAFLRELSQHDRGLILQALAVSYSAHMRLHHGRCSDTARLADLLMAMAPNFTTCRLATEAAHSLLDQISHPVAGRAERAGVDLEIPF